MEELVLKGESNLSRTKGFLKLKMLILFIFILSLSYFFIRPTFEIETTSAETSSFYFREDSIITITVTAAGDAMAHMPQIQAAFDAKSNRYDFNSVFQNIKPILRTSDLNIVNLETNLAGEPYSGYPRFSAPDSFAAGLINTGFNFFLNANNHCADKDYEGLNKTIAFLDARNVPHVGIYKNDSDRKAHYPYILSIKGITLGILNYTYGTNGNKVSGGGVINYINQTAILNDLKSLNDKHCDVIIACIHWGTEYDRMPDASQLKTERFLIENGVNVIIGSHPHVIQPLGMDTVTINKELRSALVYWSLGNFVSNQRQQYTDGGILARFQISKNKISGKVVVKNESFIPCWVYRTDDSKQYALWPVYQFEKDSISLNHLGVKLKTDFLQFASDTRKHLLGRDTNIVEWKP